MTTPEARHGPVADMGLFPGQNPHPVLRMSTDGRLVYANAAATPITSAWGVAVGEALAEDVAGALRAAAATAPPGRVEVIAGGRTFDVLPIAIPGIGAYNLYGTDITAEKVVERFPGDNPNPVLRMTPGGELLYANAASRPITEALGLAIGQPLAGGLYDALSSCLADPRAPVPEVPGAGGLTFRLKPVLIPEFGFVNLYATDITAEKAIDVFPNQNPNPVLRLSRSGRMTYANPASALVRKALRAEVGADLEEAVLARVLAASENVEDPTMDVEAEGVIYRLRVIQVYEFDSINLYGTDITAARQVEELSHANEALLLNILPPSIAARLRGGERVIADRLDDMAVLFADVVGFTEISSRLSPTDVVGLLNQIFSRCDELAERFGLEKIKTVGDAYMVVGGIGHEDHDDGAQELGGHPADVADMGLAILDELRRFQSPAASGLQVRVGMHVGPAVAGVIGLKKFIYDVWGDTVNTASRMESTGVPGRFQVTRATVDRLRDDFEFEPRGVIDVKGKGPTETWFLLRRRAGDLASAAAAAAAARASAP